MDRRAFFQTTSFAGAACISGRPVSANEAKQNLADVYGVLVDVTKCIGCRKCEWACNESNHLPTQTLESWETQDVFSMQRRPDSDHYTIVNQYHPPAAEKPLNVKFQCMHCDDPACVSACLVSALEKRENGAVEYDAGRCMGCRYCMIACPFQIPAYEYDEPLVPKVQKCTFCIERISDGGVPACVEVCPPQCLTFGKRDELITLAHQLVDTHPDDYIDHVYGEHEVGGASWMYISSQPFEDTGLPTLGTEAPPQITEPLQHGIFKHFIPQAAAFGVLAMTAAFTKRTKEVNETDEHISHAAPVERQFITPGVIALMLVAGAGLLAGLWRFIFGIGSVTNLNDQFPWGIWIAIDVATGVALAAGGFTTAAVAHIFHREKYHDLVRPALLTAVLGYTFVVIGLTADLGRYYNVWHPMMPWMWSGHSVLFEVGLCVTFYLTVLYIEFLPIVAERFKGRVNLPSPLSVFNKPIDSFLTIADATLSKVMMFFIIAGVVLSFMHQSSLGALMMIAPWKMNTLWYTPILPLLFLLSAISVGFPMVIFESVLASKSFKRKPELHLLSSLSKAIPVLLLIYLSFKIGDLAVREQLGLMFDGSTHSLLFLIEVGLGVALPMIMLCFENVRRSVAGLMTASTLVVLGVAFNRINVFLSAYRPVYQVERYMPSIIEILVTAGLISALVLVYRFIVILLPVLPKEHDALIDS